MWLSSRGKLGGRLRASIVDLVTRLRPDSVVAGPTGRLGDRYERGEDGHMSEFTVAGAGWMRAFDHASPISDMMWSAGLASLLGVEIRSRATNR
jgi:hypothetical protein